MNWSRWRGKRITLRARRVVTAILVLILGLIMAGELLGITKSQL